MNFKINLVQKTIHVVASFNFTEQKFKPTQSEDHCHGFVGQKGCHTGGFYGTGNNNHSKCLLQNTFKTKTCKSELVMRYAVVRNFLVHDNACQHTPEKIH